jgi:hypothetical protein
MSGNEWINENSEPIKLRKKRTLKPSVVENTPPLGIPI